MTDEGSPGPDDRDRVDSWKAIAAYLGRGTRTVQRWEREEGLPVRRHVHSSHASVHALRSELDAWRRSRERTAEIPVLPALALVLLALIGRGRPAGDGATGSPSLGPGPIGDESRDAA